MHHVAIGQDQAIGREHESRASALTLARFTRAASARLHNINLDHGWTDRFSSPDHSLGVSIEQSRVVERTPQRSLSDRF